MTGKTYRQAGVDLEAADEAKTLFGPHVRSTFGPNVMSDVGLFGGLVGLAGYQEPVLVASTDGVGTKLKIAYWMDSYETIGHDVVNQSVNDVLTAGAKPLFFLDYIGIENVIPTQIEVIVKGIAEACRVAGCALLGGETAQLSGVFQRGAFELAGFAVGVVERSKILDPTTVTVGDILIALPSSGLHTNGYSLVRLAFDLDDDPSALHEFYPDLNRTLGDALLEPHRSYYPMLEPALPYLKAVAHITGGGAEHNIARVMPEGLYPLVDLGKKDIPPIFKIIQAQGKITDEEMARVFNLGVGMVLVCSPNYVDTVLDVLDESWVMGEVLVTN